MGNVVVAKFLDSIIDSYHPQNPKVIEMLTEFGKRVSKNKLFGNRNKSNDEFYNAGLKKFRRGFAGITFAFIGANDITGGGGHSYQREIEENEAIRRVVKMGMASDHQEARDKLQLLVSAPRDITFRVDPPYNIEGIKLERKADSFVVTYLPIDGG